MKRLFSFFRGLRGKLTLTYTLVTVLALLALEILLLVLVVLLSSLLNDDKRAYLRDVNTVLGSEARPYLQPGKVDAPGLQAWLEKVRANGYASLAPTGLFDSPAAAIAGGSSMYVLSPEGVVLAQAPAGPTSLVGQVYTAPNYTGAERALQRALAGESTDPLRVSVNASSGNLWMAAPVKAALDAPLPTRTLVPSRTPLATRTPVSTKATLTAQAITQPSPTQDLAGLALTPVNPSLEKAGLVLTPAPALTLASAQTITAAQILTPTAAEQAITAPAATPIATASAGASAAAGDAAGPAQPPVLGVVIVTVRPAPPMFLQVWPALLVSVLVTGVLLLMAVTPFGALFGYIMSRRLTRRLAALTQAADAWGEGNFSAMPSDRANDEIGFLAIRMRLMAERVQTLLQSQQQLAMMEERNRLARELHDTVKQQAFATLMQVRAARNLIETAPGEAAQRLEEAEWLIKTSQQDLGLILAELRPAALEGQGLAGALRAFLDNWSQNARIPAELNVTNERGLPLEVEQALYRVAQEALSNVVRHSRASAVTVRLAYDLGQVCLSVSDNGVGFNALEGRAAGRARGYGLQSMRERLEALHGWLAIESQPGNGTAVSATVPVE